MKLSDSGAAVLYCDNHIAIACKPSGWLTQDDGSGTPSLEAFVKLWIQKQYKKPGNVFLHCIHRLDRPVSGLVLFAKTSKALSRLNELSRKQEIQRIYIAEVEGILSIPQGKLDHYLIHGDHKAIVSKEGASDAKHARLTYATVAVKPRTTVVQIELETGRYHQIRAQFSAIGHPILGDVRYGGSSIGDEAIHLHCTKIAFLHPVSQETISIESPVRF